MRIAVLLLALVALAACAPAPTATPLHYRKTSKVYEFPVRLEREQRD